MPDQFPPDDTTITNDELLFLRIFPDVDSIEPIPEGGGFRPNSGELRSDGALSVDLGSVCPAEQTRDRDTSRPFHVAAIPVGLARSYGCRVVRDPLPENSAHALLYGDRRRDDGTKEGFATGSLTKSQTKNIGRRIKIVLLNPLAPIPGHT